MADGLTHFDEGLVLDPSDSPNGTRFSFGSEVARQETPDRVADAGAVVAELLSTIHAIHNPNEQPRTVGAVLALEGAQSPADLIAKTGLTYDEVYSTLFELGEHGAVRTVGSDEKDGNVKFQLNLSDAA